MSALVLIVEDEPLLARNMKTFLGRRGHQVVLAGGIAEGRLLYAEKQPDIVLVDHNLPDGTGLAFIQDIRRQDRWTKLVMITAYGGIDIAVSAMKSGADDYLTKPVPLDEIAIVVEKLLLQGRLEHNASFAREKERERSGLDRIVGTSPAILAMKQKIRFVTAAERSADLSGAKPGPGVLITGETGTGKELIARALHFDGPRAGQPFIGVNCAALPDHLVESELFGHEKGAFTGASEKKIGLFQAADGGTLFLDEIGELPLAQQAKILKAIEDATIRPVGGVRERSVNIRFLAATNAPLDELASRQAFRSDLLYRLNTVTIEAPPLRDRGQDIVLLAETFLGEFQRRYGRAGMTLGSGAAKALLRYPWPGNIRQLRNVMEQACLMAPASEIAEEYLGLRPVPTISPDMPAGGGEASLPALERRLIIDALRQNAGNVTLASRKLGISRDTLRYRMEKFSLARDEFS